MAGIPGFLDEQEAFYANCANFHQLIDKHKGHEGNGGIGGSVGPVARGGASMGRVPPREPFLRLPAAAVQKCQRIFHAMRILA
jgi:hypothetical protein